MNIDSDFDNNSKKEFWKKMVTSIKSCIYVILTTEKNAANFFIINFDEKLKKNISCKGSKLFTITGR